MRIADWEVMICTHCSIDISRAIEDRSVSCTYLHRYGIRTLDLLGKRHFSVTSAVVLGVITWPIDKYS